MAMPYIYHGQRGLRMTESEGWATAFATGMEDGWDDCPITANPYPCYTELWQSWLDGWEDGVNSG